MLSIFEQKEFEGQPERKLTLNRLQSVLGPQAPAPAAGTAVVTAVAEPAAPAASVAEPVVAGSRPNPRLAEPRPPEPPPVATPTPAVEQTTAAISTELDNFAEQFTRGFREVLASTVRDIQSPMVEEQKKLGTMFDDLSKANRDVEALHGDMNGAYERLATLGKTIQDISARLGKIEDAVNITTAAVHSIQDGQHAIEKRLELQAAAIRTLHASSQARDEKLEKIVGAFQTLQSVNGERGNRRPLPDEL